MTDAPWLEHAKQLACGSSDKIMCCSSTPCMMINHTQRGYSCFCFKCGYSGFIPHGNRSISTLKQHKAEWSYQQSKDIRLPADYTKEIPIKAADWFLTCGITRELAAWWGFGFSKYYNRIIIPVFECGVANPTLIAVQARAIDKEQTPKYINLQQKNDKTTMFWCTTDAPHESVIITEDVLSAIKIHHRTGLDTVSLLGSNLNAEKACILTARYKHIWIWLDNDKAGWKGTREAKNQLQLQGAKNIYTINSILDPKCYTTEKMWEYIYWAERC